MRELLHQLGSPGMFRFPCKYQATLRFPSWFPFAVPQKMSRYCTIHSILSFSAEDATDPRRPRVRRSPGDDVVFDRVPYMAMGQKPRTNIPIPKMGGGVEPWPYFPLTSKSGLANMNCCFAFTTKMVQPQKVTEHQLNLSEPMIASFEHHLSGAI